MLKGKDKKPKISLFGHFGGGNFGNESTLQAMLCHIRRTLPDAEITCICTAPEFVAANYKIAASPMTWVVVKSWNLHSPLARFARKMFIGIPSEVYRWLVGIKILWDKDALIVVGTGLMTDAFRLDGWGPYGTFKWSMIAKLSRCRLLFVSVGAGPLSDGLARFLATSALSLADFRSYRDESTLQYLRDIGFRSNGDQVYPDLAFSLPAAVLPNGHTQNGRRLVVGLGLMDHVGMYGKVNATSADYSAYVETLAAFVKWLLDREYDVRLLIGDRNDMPILREFRAVLKGRLSMDEDRRITDKPAQSVEDLLSQLAETDLVVGTRFHNVLLALLLNKPTISISFHHKCSSLMSQMGLSEYCQDIKQLNADKLIEQFCQLEKNSESLRQMIRERVADCRKALDEQYSIIFKDLLLG
ncbi:MAG: polysaccharide pyruvyl transferase family protein [Candidatus Acidiferrales bacterium]